MRYLSRKIYARWMKVTRYEFWPAAVFYAPGILYYLLLCIRHGRLGLVGIANPGMTEQGIFQAPKVGVLNQLARENPDYVARCITLPRGQRAAWPGLAADFISQHQLEFPVIVKPQVGQRGADIKIAHDAQELASALAGIPDEALYMVQEYAPGIEYGVHYVRFPNETTGKIFSLGRKDLIHLSGDGRSSLERLIMRHPRASIMYKIHLAKHKDKLNMVLAAGEQFKLVQIGTHSRGAIFVDVNHLKTEELERRIDQISKGYPGFYIGRYDLLAKSERDLQEGRNFKIVELNSVMGEPPHMYHPSNSIWRGYSILFHYVRLVVEIARQNLAQGVRPKPWREFLSYARNSYSELT